MKKGVVKNFAKFTGKHLFWGLFFKKIASLHIIEDLIRYKGNLKRLVEAYSEPCQTAKMECFANYFCITLHLRCLTGLRIRPRIALLHFQTHLSKSCLFLADNNMFKVNNRNTSASCEICSKLTIKIPERRYWRRSGIFIVNFEHISHLVLVFLLLTLSR